MADQDAVRRIALPLLETTEEEGAGYRVAGKLFVWTYLKRAAPKAPTRASPGRARRPRRRSGREAGTPQVKVIDRQVHKDHVDSP